MFGPYQQPPTIANLSTASITSTSVNLKEITAKITITPAEENPVITGVRLYFNTGATVDKEGRTLIGTYEYSQFNDNTITVTKEAPNYNTQYTISVDAYYSGVVPELVQATPDSATVTTTVSLPQPVTSFAVSPYSGVRVLAAWNNPSNVQNFNGVKIEYKTGSQDAWTPGTGTQIYQGTGTSAGAGQRSTVYLDMPALSSQYTLMAYTYGSLTGTTQNSSTVIDIVTTSGN